MNIITQQEVLKALAPVQDPEIKESLVKLGMIEDITIDIHNNIEFKLMLTTLACPLKEFIQEECIEALKTLPDIGKINIILGSKPLAQKKLELPNIDTKYFEGVKYVIMVASGKGGVGKTTVAVNLALALKHLGAKVGILDADIYGPNIPNMLGESNAQLEILNEDEKEIMIPLTIQDIPVLSMSFFIEKTQPVMWRGPMLNSIMQQFLFQSKWGELDYLIIDTPPGTGDIQMSLSQMAPIDGVIIVTTAQNASITDVKRSIAQFEKLHAPILGVVENMSYFVPEDEPTKSYDLFGSKQGQTIKSQIDLPVLSCLPFSTQTREASDAQIPIVIKNPESIISKEFIDLAKKVSTQISLQRLKH